tara:strand:- start:18 stop:800 length:783 start_codon:yes stop_codon:yes gene_type:complete
MSFLGTLAATVLGGALVGEINRKRAPKQKAAIGSGTAPTLESGIPLEIQEILGTEATSPEEASQGQEGRSLPNTDEEMLMQLLQQDPEGIMGMYTGGNVQNYADGGATGGLFGFGLLNNMDPIFDLKSFYENQSEEVQDIIDNTLSSGILALIKKREEPKGSIVSTRTLPAGNANRRRLQFDPIGMEGGGVLDRKMFKPMLGGGELDGPGGPKDDLIPIMASDGEFMLSKATVDMLGNGNHSKGISKLNKINNKGNRMYG